MTAKQYLRQLQRIGYQIEAIQEQILRIRSRLESTTIQNTGERVQSSSMGDQFASQIAALVDKEREYQAMLMDYEILRTRIIDKIVQLPDGIHVKLLTMVYVDNYSLKAAADQLHYSYDRIVHIHGEALSSFAKIYLRDDG